MDKNEAFEQQQWIFGMTLTIQRTLHNGTVDGFTKQDYLDIENGAEGIMIAARKAREAEFPE